MPPSPPTPSASMVLSATPLPPSLASAYAQQRLASVAGLASFAAACVSIPAAQTISGGVRLLALAPLMRALGYKSSSNIASGVKKFEECLAKWVREDSQRCPYDSVEECKNSLIPRLRIESDEMLAAAPLATLSSASSAPRYISREGLKHLLKVLSEWEPKRQPLASVAAKSARSVLLELAFKPQPQGETVAGSEQPATPHQPAPTTPLSRRPSTVSSASGSASPKIAVTPRSASGSSSGGSARGGGSPSADAALQATPAPPANASAELRRQRAAERQQRRASAHASDVEQKQHAPANLDAASDSDFHLPPPPYEAAKPASPIVRPVAPVVLPAHLTGILPAPGTMLRHAVAQPPLPQLPASSAAAALATQPVSSLFASAASAAAAAPSATVPFTFNISDPASVRRTIELLQQLLPEGERAQAGTAAGASAAASIAPASAAVEPAPAVKMEPAAASAGAPAASAAAASGSGASTPAKRSTRSADAASASPAPPAKRSRASLRSQPPTPAPEWPGSATHSTQRRRATWLTISPSPVFLALSITPHAVVAKPQGDDDEMS